MIPLRDEKAGEGFPWVVLLLLLANIGIFVFQLSLSDAGLSSFLARYAAHPKAVVSFHGHGWREAIPGSWLTLLTSLFLHGSLFHLLGNMLYLWIFGDNIEQAFGRIRFVFFYLLCGAVATLTHVFYNAASMTPLIGASGAISGVLGAYLLLFPRHRIDTLFWLIIIIRIIPIPAFFFIGFWFLQQILLAPGGGQVAWYAHIGGFISGMVMTPFFVKKKNWHW